MQSTAYGIGWHYWRKHRLGFLLLLVYGGGVASFSTITSGFGSWLLPSFIDNMIAILCLPLMYAFVYLMGVFTHPEADIASTQSAYPSYLLRLPIRSSELVAWPMLFGAASVGLLWIFQAFLIYHPAGMDAPYFWPAALNIAIVASLQAIFWSPTSVPYLKVVLAFTVIPGLLWWALSESMNRQSSEIGLTIQLLMVLPIAYLVAYMGVSQARRGGITELALPFKYSFRKHQISSGSRFGSSAQAQEWLEWKRNGLFLPLFVLATILIFTLPLIWVQEKGPLGSMLPVPFSMKEIEVSVCLPYALAVFGLAPYYAMLIGCGLRKGDTRQKDLSLHPFYALRPMSTADLLLARLKMAALSAAATFGILALFIGLWLLLPAQRPFPDSMTLGPLGEFLLPTLTPSMVSTFLFAAVAMALLLWRSQVGSLFMDLSGKRWLVQGYRIGILLLAAEASFMLVWLVSIPGNMEKFIDAIPALGAAVFVLKLGAGAGVLEAIRCRKLASEKTLIRFVLGWIGVTALLSFWLYTLLPEQLQNPVYVTVAVGLFLPLVRPWAALLVLEGNRHRH